MLQHVMVLQLVGQHHYSFFACKKHSKESRELEDEAIHIQIPMPIIEYNCKVEMLEK